MTLMQSDVRDLSREIVNKETMFQTRACQRLLRWWLAYENGPPRKEQFDILDHAPIAGHLYLFERLKPGRYLYKLNGESVVELIGSRLSGHEFGTSDSDPVYAPLAEYLETILRDGKPRRCFGNFRHLGRPNILFESVDLPLADREGRITHIIGAMSGLNFHQGRRKGL